ncbi:hypothetical protein Q4577_15760 [Marinovum sp. 2_MG-2023]|uniref:hypothetical protein n=1 Tax=unclassified Marinovum TaxID=2647166 RepID=UPI0026E4404B|nr:MULTISPECIES: hypothetical protein [unclassified Marinovum]MDO6731490.1 hypothetical protein [Marinovum sp. 2_MG-2023]MDO6780850.1 hypothetical protein [Marinovum sp. 1_MG-2023]
MMKMLTYLTLAVAIGLTPALADAACVAEYKAKRDNPLALFFDTAQINGPCTKANAQTQLRAMLAQRGLTLLKVVSVGQG